MKEISRELAGYIERRLDAGGVSARERPAYRKWIRYYLDFCEKYGHPPRLAGSLGPFLEKLAAKKQTGRQREEAARAVELLLAECGGAGGRVREEEPGERGPAEDARAGEPAPGRGASWEREYRELEGMIRMRNYSGRTLDTYRMWARKFQGFVKSKAPGDLGPGDVKAFLTDLAVREGVAASTQNQAFNALLFFFRHVLGREFGQLDGVVRAKRRPYVPVVLSRKEVEAVLGFLDPPFRLAAELLYGCGLRLSECLELRMHCFNLDALLLTVHDGKGQKDRTVPLPERSLPAIESQMAAVRARHEGDLAAGYSGVFLPRRFEKKSPGAATEFIWQWFFPATKLTTVPKTGEKRRYHLHDSQVQAAVKRAAAEAGLLKRVTPHTFRHTFASHLLLAGYDLPTIQKLLGHASIKTTMIYLQTVPSLTIKEAKSPLDLEAG